MSEQPKIVPTGAGQGAGSAGAARSGIAGATGWGSGPAGYHGLPIVKRPAWTWEVPWYLFTGGLAGAGSALALVARLTGNHRLARGALLTAGSAAAVSPALLISDLGVPSRFLNMLRVFKPTSPMSVGSWLLAAYAPLAVGAAGAEALRIAPRLGRAAEVGAGLLGPAVATYTGVLVADTAIPVWHEARRELPFLFGGSGAASAGAAAVLMTPHEEAGPARRLALLGAAMETVAGQAMEARLGGLGAPYHEGVSGTLALIARSLTALGAGLGALRGRRSRLASVIAALLLLAGAACERWAVYKAGFASAEDPSATIDAQRRRMAETGSSGATTRPSSGSTPDG